MIATKKTKLIRKHLGVNTPEWVVKNCIDLLKEYEEIEWCGVAETEANGAETRTEPELPIQHVIDSLPDFLYEDEGEIKVGVHGNSTVTDEWKKWKAGYES